MRIGLIGHDLADPVGRGLQRYCAGLARALSACPDVELTLFSRVPPLPRFDDIGARREVWPGGREALWEQLQLPRRAARLGIDVLHAPGNRGLPLVAGCSTVVTRHDEIERLFPPDFPGTVRDRVRTFYADRVAMRTASRIVTVSERSRDDIRTVWRVAPQKVTVCGEGIHECFFAEPSVGDVARVRRRYALAGPYLLYVGGFDRRKQVGTLLDAFFEIDRPDVTLALCGPLRGEGTDIRNRVRAHPLGDRVRVPGAVPDADLPALYAGCQLFVYPSRYEGFGLQAIEAMAAGAPVVSSDGGALPETVGEAGVLFPAGDVSACARAVQALLADADQRERLRRLGRERAQRFRWDRVVTRYLELYRELTR